MLDDTPVTYDQWVRWLESRHPMPTIAPGLERTLLALETAGLLGKNDPERTIHIAGTNGKGTTAKALEHLLIAAGESVGLFTSPHLVSTCERIATGGAPISEDEFVSLCEKHLRTVESCNLTHFEALTLFALDYFLNVKKTKWMIFEIGLGGTWDSTNAIPHRTSIITALGFDHMHILGSTIEEIAGNKFGIINDGNLVIHQKYSPSVAEKLEAKLAETGSTGFAVETLEFAVETDLVPRYTVHFRGRRLRLRLPGRRAVENASTAIAAFLKLGFSEKYVESLAELHWPARMTEIKVPQSPCPIYASGDHNEQGLESLCELLTHSTYKKLHVVLGLSKNRSHRMFVDRLASLRDASIVFTAPSFQGVIPEGSEFSPYFAAPEEALQACLDRASSGDLIVVTGSLYLCGELLSRFPS